MPTFGLFFKCLQKQTIWLALDIQPYYQCGTPTIPMQICMMDSIGLEVASKLPANTHTHTHTHTQLYRYACRIGSVITMILNYVSYLYNNIVQIHYSILYYSATDKIQVTSETQLISTFYCKL